MVDGGPIDVLTGDWLAELTMLILSRIRAKRPGQGYARTFVGQMEQVMGTCLDSGIKVVSNAGGLDPEEWSGFAFGFGIDRMAIMRHGVADIREMFADDIRFLEQF